MRRVRPGPGQMAVRVRRLRRAGEGEVGLRCRGFRAGMYAWMCLSVSNRHRSRSRRHVSLQIAPPPFSQAVFLRRASGRIRLRHLNEPSLNSRPQGIVQECGPVTESQASHCIVRSQWLFPQRDQKTPHLFGYLFDLLFSPLDNFALNSG